MLYKQIAKCQFSILPSALKNRMDSAENRIQELYVWAATMHTKQNNVRGLS